MREFAGVRVVGDRIEYKGSSGLLRSARASVDTAGQIRSRPTLTRAIALGGIGALVFKKKVDERELYLCVEGDGFAFVAPVNPNKGLQAREFAAHVNQQAARLAALPPQTNGPAVSALGDVLYELGAVRLTITSLPSPAPAVVSTLNSAFPGLDLATRKQAYETVLAGRTFTLASLTMESAEAFKAKLEGRGFGVAPLVSASGSE